MTAVTTGRLFKCVPQFLIVYPFAAVMTGTVVFLLFWEREPNYLILFTFVAVLGMCEGMWFNIPPSMSKFITMIILFYSTSWSIISNKKDTSFHCHSYITGSRLYHWTHYATFCYYDSVFVDGNVLNSNSINIILSTIVYNT